MREFYVFCTTYEKIYQHAGMRSHLNRSDEENLLQSALCND